MLRASVLALSSLALGACAGLCPFAATDAALAPRPAPILHLVYFTLADAEPPEAVAELLADCERWLRPIDGVVAYAAGRHLDIGRDNVSGDYDLALFIGFDDEASYRAYLVDPAHLELIAKWQSRWAGVTIHDVLDEPAP
jgi:hypothetical protein